MTKKEKSMEELLEKVSIEKLKLVGVNDTEITKVEALHDLLKKGKTWKDEEVKRLFGVLPDSFPFCQAYIHNEALIRIGKAKPIKVISIPGEKDSRRKWIPIEKADELGVPAALPIKGYEIICSQCESTFIGKEPFHQNFCYDCVGKKPSNQKEETTPDQKPKQKMDKSTPVDSTPAEKPKPATVGKRRGRPKKSESPKSPTTKDKPKAKRGRPPKKDSGKKAVTKKTSSKSKRSPSRPTKKKGGSRKKK